MRAIFETIDATKFTCVSNAAIHGHTKTACVRSSCGQSESTADLPTPSVPIYLYQSNTPAVVQNPAPRAQSINPSHYGVISKHLFEIEYSPTATPPSTLNTKLLHPYLKLWEDRDFDNPYEPIFITRDEKLDAETRRSFVIEKPEQHSNRSEYQKPYDIPAADYLLGFF